MDEFAESHGISKAEARQDQEARVEQSIPLGRMGDVTEIVPLLLLVASERSTWMTGSCLVIDGGKVRAVH